MNKITKILLVSIIVLGAFLRLYKLDQVPPSLNWDETAAAYNAYTIANWGRDEWGDFMPLVFTSFRDDKHPVHIYLTALIIKILGVSDFNVRLSGALIGILSIIVIFFLGKVYFKTDLVGLLAALFLAISPYHLQFSRGVWEADFAPFFFMLGLLLFQLALLSKKWLFEFSFLSFGLSLLSYHSSKVVVPPVVFLLLILNIKSLIKSGKHFYFGLLVFLFFIILIVSNRQLLGFARAYQTRVSEETIKNTTLFKLTNNYYLGTLGVGFDQYLLHFSSDYLFRSGDQNPRNSVKIVGEFYKSDALFIFIGVIMLVILRSKISLILLSWLLLSPFPSSLVSHPPNATRTIFLIGSIHLIAALGAASLIDLYKGLYKKIAIYILICTLAIQVYPYLNYYYNSYPKKDAIEWVYGMKEIVDYVKYHPEYDQVFMTDVRAQPYIFFLYYLKTPLPEYLNTVLLNREREGSSNMVSTYGKYYFGGWDTALSMPTPGILYIVTPPQYTGLMYKRDFEVKKIVYYPDGSTAFYLVSKY